MDYLTSLVLPKRRRRVLHALNGCLIILRPGEKAPFKNKIIYFGVNKG